MTRQGLQRLNLAGFMLVYGAILFWIIAPFSDYLHWTRPFRLPALLIGVCLLAFVWWSKRRSLK
jgi:peptidoglycan/LPS O-acetylase OafA/YrhL